MERSPYLTQAMQQMQAAPEAAPASPDLAAMAAAIRKRKAWEEANPGGNYLQHTAQSALEGLRGAPQALAGGVQNLAAIPGNLAGLLGRR